LRASLPPTAGPRRVLRVHGVAAGRRDVDDQRVRTARGVDEARIDVLSHRAAANDDHGPARRSHCDVGTRLCREREGETQRNGESSATNSEHGGGPRAKGCRFNKLQGATREGERRIEGIADPLARGYVTDPAYVGFLPCRAT